MSDQNQCNQHDGQQDESSCQYLKTEKIAEGKWLSLNKVHYQDPKGKQRVWETINRTTKHEGSADCVVVIATLKRLLHYDCLVLVKQFRPPVHSYTIEFPAGLIDDDETPEIAAVRELKEETGYVASVKHLSPATCLDPGTEDCTAILVTAEIDGDMSYNKRPESNPAETEFIEVLLIPINELLDKLNELSAQGCLVDARVYTYAVALVQATKQRRLEPVMK